MLGFSCRISKNLVIFFSRCFGITRHFRLLTLPDQMQFLKSWVFHWQIVQSWNQKKNLYGRPNPDSQINRKLDGRLFNGRIWPDGRILIYYSSYPIYVMEGSGGKPRLLNHGRYSKKRAGTVDRIRRTE